MTCVCCNSVLESFPLFVFFFKATDTPEDRSNPVLLYNKMELGDFKANFTLEVESQVKKTTANPSESIVSHPPSILLIFFLS